jgi:hypothetical protein
MSGSNWTDGSKNGNWYTAGNWSNGVPANSAAGTTQITISGTIAAQPTISPAETGATDVIHLTQSGTSFEDSQIDGLIITLQSGADPVIQGVALGTPTKDTFDTNITNLTAAPNATATYDSHMVITALGTDSLTFNDVNHNFGLIEATGAGNDLNITIAVGGNTQAPHALYNYGEILAAAGATVSADILTSSGTTTTNFGNAGWIMVEGGTFTTNTGISDGANVQNAAGTPDGYIEIGTAGSAILLGTVAAKEEVLFLDGNHNVLEISNGNAFEGSVTSFATGDTIEIAGLTSPVSLSYAGSLLSVAELNSAGTITATTTIDIGTSYTATQFLGLTSTSGLDIVTGAAAVATGFTLHATGAAPGVANFEDASQYVGKVAPGSTLVGGETVTIVPTSFAEITTSLANNGTILLDGLNADAEAFVAVTGTGTIALTGGADLNIANTVGITTNTIAFSAPGANTNILSLTGTAADFSGAITGFGSNDEIVLTSSILPSGTAGASFTDSYNTATGALIVTETSAAGAVVGTETLNIVNTGSLTAGSFVDISGTGGLTIALGSTALGTSGSIFIDRGEAVTLSNTSAVDTIPVTFGSHGTSLALNVLDLNGSVASTNNPYTGAITGFGLNDDIILGPSVLPSVAAGAHVSLSYTGSLLSVSEFNSGGTLIGSTALDVGTGYAANSFVALLGTNGVNIETPATVDEQPLTYSGTGLGSFENPANYKGGLAPGSVIVAGETVSVVSGTASIAATSPLANAGSVILSGAGTTLIDSSSLAGLGTVFVGGGAALTLANATGVTTNTIIFGATGNNILALDGTGPASFNGTIGGIGGTDTIDLGGSFLPTPASTTAIGLSFNTASGILSITDTVGGTIYTDTLHISGTVPGVFQDSIGPNGIVITDIPCFAAGTRILTPNGQVAVENLAVGDTVLTVRDGSSQKIIWRGQRTIELGRHANPEKVMPVRILAGAFAAGTPERDLVLSPDHALFIDGHLIEAKTLVNGATIIRDTAAKFITYHHVELERHDVVLAEGVATETYLDSGNRRNFESDALPTILHPDFAATCRDKACAPLLLDGDIVRAARQALLDRAASFGFNRTSAIEPTAKVGLERLLPQPGATPEEWLFVLPAGATSLELLSATGVPAEISADPSDRRSLGLAIAGLALIASGTRTEIALDEPAHSGLHAAEASVRWTNGHARIALPEYRGRAVLEVTFASQATRWRAPAPLGQTSVL